MNIDRIISHLEDIERLPLAIVTMAGPWLTPLIPAYFVASAISTYLHAPLAMAIVAGFVLEVVGIAGIANATRAYLWNQTKRKTDPAAPLTLSLIAASIYFLTAILLTVIVELRTELAAIAPGMFVILSVSSGLILVLSSTQRLRERNVATERQSRRQQKRQPNPAISPATGTLTTTATRQRAATILAERSDISGSELGRLLGKSERTGRWLKAELNGNHNGTGAAQ